MKNFLKKVSLLSSAALLALGLSAPMASAVAPSQSDMGALYGSTGSIGKATPGEIELTLLSGIYSGNPQQIITAVTQGAPEGATLYLRVADGAVAPTAEHNWVAYEDANSLNNSALKRTNVGTYNVYYWIDGGNNYNDVTTAPQP